MLPNRTNNKKNRKYRKKGSISYSGNKYHNPFFTNKRKNIFSAYRFVFSKKVKIIVFIFLILIVCLIIILFYSKFFIIKEIKVSGDGRIKPELIEKIAKKQIADNFFVLFPQKNIFLFNRNSLRDKLNDRYAFNSLEINKKLPDKLLINFNEKKYAIIWYENDSYYYADENGYVIEETNPLEITGKDYPLIKNLVDNKIVNKEIIIEKKYIDYILILFNKFKNFEDEYIIDNFFIDNEINTIKIKLKEGPEVFFNIEVDIDKQINKLKILKTEKISDDFYKKSYIDVRYGDSVYYR